MSEPVPGSTPAPRPSLTPAPAPPTAVTGAPPIAAGTADARTPSMLVGLLVLVAVVVAVALVLRGQGAGAPGRVEALLARGRTLARDPDAGAAAAVAPLVEAYQLAPQDVRVNAALGQALLAQNRFEEALPYLAFAREHAPDDASAHVDLGVCLTGLERHADARPVLERALALTPDDPMPLYFLGVGAMRLRDNEATAGYLTRYTARVPRNKIALQILVDALDALGRGADAIAPLSKLSALDPADVRLRREIQERTVARDGYAAVASSALAAATAPVASSVDLYLAGRLLAQDHRTVTQARAALARAQALAPDDPWPALALGVEAMRDGHADEARAAFEGLLTRFPDFWEADAQLALLARDTGDVDAACARAQRLLGAGHATALAREVMAAALGAAGRGDEAVTFARSLVSPGASPGDPSRFLEAQADTLAGQFDAAGEILAKLRESAPAGARFVWWGFEALNELDAGRDVAAVAAFDAALAAAPAGQRIPPSVLLWSGVARVHTDVEAARRQWEQAATTGRAYNPEALYTWACRRLLGRASAADVLGAARIGGGFDTNDALFVEGLACELEGDIEAARAAYRRARDTSHGNDFPRRLVDRALAR